MGDGADQTVNHTAALVRNGVPQTGHDALDVISFG
jgi:hypothetical protein